MCNLYNLLIALCEKNQITGYRMCKDTGISPGAMTDLKMGRRETLSAGNMNKLANYFGVTVGYLLGEEDNNAKPQEQFSEVDKQLLSVIKGLSDSDKLLMLNMAKAIKSSRQN